MKKKNKIPLLVILITGSLTFTSFADAILNVTEIFQGDLTSDAEVGEWIEIQNTGDTAYSNNLFLVDQNAFDGGFPGDREQIFTDDFYSETTVVIQPGEIMIVLNEAFFDPQLAADNFQNFWFGHTNSGLQFAYIFAGQPFDSGADSAFLYDNDTVADPTGALALGSEGYDIGLATNSTATYSFIPGSSLLTPTSLTDGVAFHSIGLADNNATFIGSPGFVAVIPEPSAIALLTFSALFLGRRRLRLKFGMTSSPLNKDSIHKYSS